MTRNNDSKQSHDSPGNYLKARNAKFRAYFPIRSRSAHWRNSPLKPMLCAIWNVENTHRSICLPDLTAVSVINGPPSLPRRREIVLARRIESGLRLQRLSSHEANERNHRQPRHYQMGQMQADLIG